MSRANGTVPLQFGPNTSSLHNNVNSLPFQIKREHQNLILKQEIPPWLSCSPIIGASLGPPPPPIDLTTTTPSLILQDFHQNQEFPQNHDHHNPNPNPSCSSLGPTTLPPSYHHHHHLLHQPPPHISATALLQKASQMGVKSSTQQQFPFFEGVASTRPHQGDDHVTSTGQGPTYGFSTPSRDQLLIHSLTPSAAATAAPSPLAHHDQMMMMNSGGLGFDDMGFGQMLSHHHHHPSSKDDQDHHHHHHYSSNRLHASVGQFSSRSGNHEGENLTRDFLGLRPLSQNDILSMTGLDSCINSNENQNQNQTPKSWQG